MPDDKTNIPAHPHHPVRLNSREMAARLRVHAKTVQRLAQQGLIPSIQVGQQLRFDPEAVEAALQRPGRLSVVEG